MVQEIKYKHSIASLFMGIKSYLVMSPLSFNLQRNFLVKGHFVDRSFKHSESGIRTKIQYTLYMVQRKRQTWHC